MELMSLKFLAFVCVVVVIYFITPKRFKWGVLLVSSYIFYYLSLTNKKYMVFILLSTISVYFAARMITSENKKQKAKKKTMEKAEFKKLKIKVKKKKKHILILCLFLNIGFLVLLKYANFLIGNINAINDLFDTGYEVNKVNFIQPLGISYYTLMAISYLLDVYYGKYEADNHIGKVALYLSFFPHITEGPIGKFDKIANQLYEPHKFDYERIKLGITIIIIGWVKKIVLADRAAIYVNNVFQDYTKYGGITLAMAVVLYTFQIYAEFSGYVDIMIGISKVLGVDLEENFRRPFFSLSIAEFWRRWHITLGTWLKDYIFYPVSLSKMNVNVNKFVKKHCKGNLASFIPIAFPLFFVWFTNGLWHGANWKYILYGLYYYIIMMIGQLCKPLAEKIITILHINIENIFYKIFQCVRTILFVLIGMALFRAHSTMDAINMISKIFTSPSKGLVNYGLNKIDFIILLIGALAMFIIGLVAEMKKNIYEVLLNDRCLAIKYAVYLVLIMSIIVFGIYGEGYDASQFIYGQF